MDGSSISIGLALLAGMASFLSPCVLSLVPAYIGYLGGRAVAVGPAGGAQMQNNRWLKFSHGLAFVSGFSVVFILLGISAGLLGALFGAASFQLNGAVYDLRVIVGKVGGVWGFSFRPDGRRVWGRCWARFPRWPSRLPGWVARRSCSRPTRWVWPCHF